MSIEAMKLALWVLEDFVDDPRAQKEIDEASAALRQAIAEAEKQAYQQHQINQLEKLKGNILENAEELGVVLDEAEKQEPVACQHKRYSIDVHEQIGTCIDCGSEGRMRFVVDDTHPQPNVTTSDMKPEHVDKTAKQRHEENT